MIPLMPKSDRTRLILQAAVTNAKLHGFGSLTRQRVADAAGVSPALVNLYLGTLPNMRRAVMRAAVKQEELRVIAEGLALRDPVALKADPALKARALQSLAGK